LPEEASQSQENLFQQQQAEKKLDAALKGKSKQPPGSKKPTAAAGSNPAGAAKSKTTKGKTGKKKATTVADADASNPNQLQSDQAHDAADEKDDLNMEKKGAEKGRETEFFEDEDVEWESDLDVDGKWCLSALLLISS